MKNLARLYEHTGGDPIEPGGEAPPDADAPFLERRGDARAEPGGKVDRGEDW